MGVTSYFLSCITTFSNFKDYSGFFKVDGKFEVFFIYVWGKGFCVLEVWFGGAPPRKIAQSS